MGPNPAVAEGGATPPPFNVYTDTRATIAVTDTTVVDVTIPAGGIVQLAPPDPLRLMVGAFAADGNVGSIGVSPWPDDIGFHFTLLAKGESDKFTNLDLPGMTFSGWWAVGTPGDRLRVMVVRRSY